MSDKIMFCDHPIKTSKTCMSICAHSAQHVKDVDCDETCSISGKTCCESKEIKTGKEVLQYDHVNPPHYKRYNVEVMDMMEKIYGTEAVMIFCELCAFKYRLRMGAKPNQPLERDLEKEAWYLKKMEEYKLKIKQS